MELLRERLSARDKLLLSQLACGHTNRRRIHSLLSLPELADADLEEFHGGTLPPAKCMCIGCFAEGNVPFLLSLSNLTGLIVFKVAFQSNPSKRGLLMITLEKKSRPEAKPGDPYDVSTGSPASTATNALVHAFIDDPEIANDNESNPSKRGLLMTTFQPRQCLGEDLEDQKPPYNLSLQSRTHVILEEEEEKELPSFGRCRPLS